MIPSISAASRSEATARIDLPSVVRWMRRFRPNIMIRLSPMTMMRTRLISNDPMWIPVESEMKSEVL